MPEPSISKRKADTTDSPKRAKRVRLEGSRDPITPAPGAEPVLAPNSEPTSSRGPVKPKHKLKKLAAPRPFPTVPTAASATGPRSTHQTGKNYIAVTRKTSLGTYLRRCKDVIMKDGYKSLHLHAMGAAISHLTLLATSIPGILPFSPSEIRTEVLTGTVPVQDELIPDDEDEDISYRTRDKSTLSIVITIGDGIDEQDAGGGKWGSRGKRRGRAMPPPPPPPKKTKTAILAPATPMVLE